MSAIIEIFYVFSFLMICAVFLSVGLRHHRLRHRARDSCGGSL